jgi:hypothetical protein
MSDVSQHLDLYDLAPKDRTVTLGLRIATTDEAGKRTLGPLVRREFRFRGDFPVPTVIRLLGYEERVKAAIGIQDAEKSEVACQAILVEAYEEILDLARSLNPIEADIELDVNGQQMLVLLAWLAGNASVAEAVIDAITAGKSLEEIEAGLTSEGLAEKAEAGGGAELGSGPLASPTPSSIPS